MAEGAEGVAAELIGRLERAWNEADGRAFGEPFAPDADFVTIRGEHIRGREAIAAGHQATFDSIYKGSSIDFELTNARELLGEVIVAHATALLKAPSGPLAGEHEAVQSLVLVRGGDGWEIAAPQHARGAAAVIAGRASPSPCGFFWDELLRTLSARRSRIRLLRGSLNKG